MRLATWNVNSIRTRVDRVIDWLERADVDVLAMQETKCADAQFPTMPFAALGYEVGHVGLNQWNGVAIASRVGLVDVEVGFVGQPAWSAKPGAASASEAYWDYTRLAFQKRRGMRIDFILGSPGLGPPASPMPRSSRTNAGPRRAPSRRVTMRRCWWNCQSDHRLSAPAQPGGARRPMISKTDHSLRSASFAGEENVRPEH